MGRDPSLLFAQVMPRHEIDLGSLGSSYSVAQDGASRHQGGLVRARSGHARKSLGLRMEALICSQASCHAHFQLFQKPRNASRKA